MTSEREYFLGFSVVLGMIAVARKLNMVLPFRINQTSTPQEVIEEIAARLGEEPQNVSADFERNRLKLRSPIESQTVPFLEAVAESLTPDPGVPGIAVVQGELEREDGLIVLVVGLTDHGKHCADLQALHAAPTRSASRTGLSTDRFSGL